MQLLKEFANVPLIGVILQELSVEAAVPEIVGDTGSVVRFKTNLQDCNPNRNKRLYSESVLTQAITAPRIQELLRTRSLLGEAGHPFSADLSRQMVIDMSRVSHLITELNVPKGGVVRGTCETAATACGRDFRGLIVENKANVAFSMRGMGGVKRVPGKDLVEVTSPLALVTYDWVTYPSHSNAYSDINNSAIHEGCAVVTAQAAAEYASAQSDNVRALVEQFELEGAEYSLTEDQMNMIVRSDQTIIKVFLESDIRADFRQAILNAF